MAEFIKWKDEWKTGIEEIDEQHREMTDVLNRLVAECERQQDRTQEQRESDEVRGRLEDLAGELYDKTRTHFRREETIMRDAEFPAYSAHVREHVMLLGELKATFLEKQREGCSVLEPDILRSLKAWLIVHITRSDREFAEYMQNR